MRKRLFVLVTVVLTMLVAVRAGDRFNFNAGWKVQVGQNAKASDTKFDDSDWQL